MDFIVSKYYFMRKKFFSNDLSIKYVLSLFFNLYLFIVFFDIMREALPVPGFANILISGMRDISLYLTVIYILVSRRSVVLGFKAFYILGYMCIPFFMWIGNAWDGNSGNHTLGTVIQFCILSAKAWLFLYVLQNLKLFYVFEKRNILKNFVSIAVFMLLFSLMVYFFFPWIITRYNLANRVGLGNMSIQSGVYCCAYILCLFFWPYKTTITNYVVLFVLFAGILLSVCSTGIIAVLISTIAFSFEKRTRKRSLIILFVIIMGCAIVVIKYYTILAAFFEYFWMKAEHVFDLIGNLFAEKKHTTKSASFHARELQIKNVLENHNAVIDRFFGHGFFSITDESIFIENTYFALYFDCGIYGLAVLASIIMVMGIKSLRFFVRNKTFLGLISLMTFLLFMTTLDISIGPGLSSAFVILFWCIFIDKSFLGGIEI